MSRRALFFALVAAYWFGMAVFLYVAFRIGRRCAEPIENGDQCGSYLAGAWQATALEVLPIVAFLAALLLFTRFTRGWRLLVYGIQLGLTALIVLLVEASYGEFSLADETVAAPWLWVAIAAAGSLAGLIAVALKVAGLSE
jgi:hypothetical protein